MKRIQHTGILLVALLLSTPGPPALAADGSDPADLLLPSPSAWFAGPRALDVNPAGLGFQQAFGAEMAISSARPSDGPVGLGGYASTFGIAVGGQAALLGDRSHGHATVGAGIPLSRGLSLGAALRLRVPGAGVSAYGAWNLGIAMRPTRWLALSGTALDLARVRDQEVRSSPRVGAGVALRPIGRRLTVALDWSYETAGASAPHHLRATLAVEPVDGLRVLAVVDEAAQVGLGLELAFPDGWIGGMARVQTTPDAAFGGWTAGVGTSSARPQTRLVPSRSIAEFRLGALKENPTVSPLAPKLAATRFSDVLEALRAMGDQRSVPVILLRLDGYGAGMARTEELRDEIARLRAGGKRVYEYLENGGSGGDYYLASACDAIWIHPAGTLSITGLSSRMFFYKSVMDTFGVDAQFSRVGRYKSSPERFTETGPTDANLEVRNALLDDRYDRWLAALSEGRGVEAGVMDALVDDAPFPAVLAQENGLVDGLLYPDQLRDRAREEAGLPRLGLREPLKETSVDLHWRSPHSIALVHLDGMINTGRSGRLPFGLLEVAGSDTIAGAIRDAREDSSIDAIVLRVDSPGGSAFASEEIWREVQRTRGVKPVVVSMASMAASGGYYASCAADRVLADPSTVTGSIGVYAGKVSLSGLYGKLGVDTVRLRRGDHAGMYATAEPWDDSELAAVERVVDYLYADFIEHVRAGRGVEDVADIDRVAQGRVWTGAQALEVGLVDELGGLMRAVEVARELASIPANADVELRASPRVGLLTSLQLGKGFVATDLAATSLIPEELRWSLSGLLLMEQQGELATLTLSPLLVEDD